MSLVEVSHRSRERDLQSELRKRIKDDCTVMNMPVPPATAVRRRQIVEERNNE